LHVALKLWRNFRARKEE